MMDILQHIGFTPDETRQYAELEKKLGEKVFPLADAYFDGRYQQISEIYEPLQQVTVSETELLGAMLLAVVRCAEKRAETLAGRKQELFLTGLCDIAFKVRECVAYKKAFGIFVMNWYDRLIKGWRVQLGRLQFEVGVHNGPDIPMGVFTLQEGEQVLYCHIPSGMGSLTRENCTDAIHRAWEEFPEFRKNGLLPILCHSWLFYPGYEQVFGKDSGVGMFRSLWHMGFAREQESFSDCWRIFSMDLPEDVSLLPRNTRMQRAFADYIAAGGSFGDASGILLYNGETIL